MKQVRAITVKHKNETMRVTHLEESAKFVADLFLGQDLSSSSGRSVSSKSLCGCAGGLDLGFLFGNDSFLLVGQTCQTLGLD